MCHRVRRKQHQAQLSSVEPHALNPLHIFANKVAHIFADIFITAFATDIRSNELTKRAIDADIESHAVRHRELRIIVHNMWNIVYAVKWAWGTTRLAAYAGATEQKKCGERTMCIPVSAKFARTSAFCAIGA